MPRGGRNKLTAEQHLRRGTFRRDRAARYAGMEVTPTPAPVITLPDTGTAGERFHAAICDAYDLEPHELVILDMACKAIDHLARLDAKLSDAPILVRGFGSAGQVSLNPLFGEVRQQQQSVAALLAKLGIDAIAADQLMPVRLSRWQVEHGARLRVVEREAKRGGAT